MNRVHHILHTFSLHQKGYYGQDIGIAILDTGLSLHPDYRSRIIGWFDTEGKTTPYDLSGHGSHVAGIAAGNGNASHGHIIGIAPKANLIGVKILNQKGNGNITDMINGMNWILKNAKSLNIRIVNISIGANHEKNSEETSPLVQKVNELWDNGLVVVAAAGNKGPLRHSISAPGNSRKIITVGSSDGIFPENHIHSGIGPTHSCIKKPDIVAPGYRIISCSPYSNRNKHSLYSIKSGTSMSTPIVSGAIALLLSCYPDMTPREVKIRLKNSSTDLHLPHEKQGWGLLNISSLL